MDIWYFHYIFLFLGTPLNLQPLNKSKAVEPKSVVLANALKKAIWDIGLQERKSVAN